MNQVLGGKTVKERTHTRTKTARLWMKQNNIEEEEEEKNRRTYTWKETGNWEKKTDNQTTISIFTALARSVLFIESSSGDWNQ